MISQYSQPLQSLNQPGITPLPFEEMMKAGQYVQKRYDDSVNATEDQYTQLANSNIIDAQKAALDNVKGTFSKEMSNLMDKYKGQTYSSDFQRESKRLISQMSSDPTVKMLKENKAQYEFDDATARQMKANRIEYYDPRLNNQAFMNEDGTAKQYKAGVRALKHDDMIEDQGAKILQAMVQSGAKTNNYKQIDRAVAAGTSDNSPIFKDKKASLIQQGYTEKDASKAAKEYITQRFNTFRKQDLDAQMMALQYKMNGGGAKTPPAAPGVIVRGESNLPANNVDKDKIQQAENVANGIDIFHATSSFEQSAKETFTPGNMLKTAAKTILPSGGVIGTGIEKVMDILGVGDKSAHEAATTEATNKLMKDADKYFGAYSKTFKDNKSKAKAYATALKSHGAATTDLQFAPSSNAFNGAFSKFLAGTDFKATEVDGSGKVIGKPGEGEFDRTDEKTQFQGISAFDPIDYSNHNSFIVSQGGKRYAISQDVKAQDRTLQFASKLAGLKLNSGQVADPKTNMMPMQTWHTDVEPGVGVITYIPIRSFTAEGVPSYKVIRVAGQPNLMQGAEAIRSVQAMPKKERDAQLFDANSLREFAINKYFTDNADIAPGISAVKMQQPDNSSFEEDGTY